MDNIAQMNLAIFTAALQGILSNSEWKGTPEDAVRYAGEVLKATHNNDPKDESVLA